MPISIADVPDPIGSLETLHRFFMFSLQCQYSSKHLKMMSQRLDSADVLFVSALNSTYGLCTSRLRGHNLEPIRIAPFDAPGKVFPEVA
jgi:hypothetical protein